MASRKHKPLSLKEKLNILAAVDQDPKRKRIDIARDLGLPASTVNTVVSKRKDIESNALVFGSATKQARGAKHGELEAALLNWFKQARASGVNFDGSILREKAMEIAKMLDIDDFTSSNGCKRYVLPAEPSCRLPAGKHDEPLDNSDPCVSDEDDMDEEIRSTGTDIAFGEFVAMNDDLATCDPQTVADIVAELRQGEVSGSDDNDDEEQERPSYVRPGRHCIGCSS
ncbi:hypothetical protein HPB47_021215 [Ixodes persulcatus]|uniref:Uncharacterized protein n=1 Tax=Ixodes persulcatus TaxID=34615 RepID=A0AC60QFB0_IXOPE|nr:hypothetical protein HPB47_021215 [Ixodes persulcatus]